MSVDNETRIACENLLLQAIASNDGVLASQALEVPEIAQLLLRMQVKDSYQVQDDAGAFFHSVASYGLAYALLDNAKSLAQRNNAQAVLEVISTIEEGVGEVTDQPDSEAAMFRTAEAAMLGAVGEDNAPRLLEILEGEHGKDLLKLKVKETLGDADDKTAFFHSVATYGLSYAFGDLIDHLADRNRKTLCRRTLRTFRKNLASNEGSAEAEVGEATTGVPMKIILTNALTGELLGELSGNSEWKTYDVIGALERDAPSQGGCRTLILGDTALEAGTLIASVLDPTSVSGGQSDIQVGLSVVSSMKDPAGTYHAKLPARDLSDLPGLSGRLIGRRRDPTITLSLNKSHSAKIELDAPPVDRGHCAGASGGCRVTASGTWAFASPGIVVTVKKAQSFRMQRGHWWPFEGGEALDVGGTVEVKLFFHDVGTLSVAESFSIGSRVRGGLGCARGTLLEIGDKRSLF
mmetsp:Transcript_87437/g.182986  ORF Transcript_87437/g.182986 Transcript_87437/m.182986 type:complete len:463 (+) Transcript_87437:115-1503(+)